jgi:hypothetical protein
MPSRSRIHSPASRPSPTAARPSSQGKLIEERRQQYMECIARFKGADTANAFADKAQRLLTSQWGRATWRARAQILDAVAWLLRLGEMSMPNSAHVPVQPQRDPR